MMALRYPPPLLQKTSLYSINQINSLDEEQREQIYRHLVPHRVLAEFGIDPVTLADDQGRSLFQVRPCSASVEVSLKHSWDAPDPLVYLQLADTASNQIEVVFFVINDPGSERFDVDRTPDGTPTQLGMLARNVAEERRAMEAGLAPAQIRRGLGLTRRLIPVLEAFVTALNHDAVYIQPLAYHNAILFERLGFAYLLGLGRMEWIHGEFGPGGLLFGRLDDSTPFRQAGMDSTVRGRSWAIHDGILGEPFVNVKMYKQVGIHAGIATFPNARW